MDMNNVAYLYDPSGERSRIAASVRAHFGNAGLSASEVARRIGMSQSKMSRRTTAAEPFDIDELSKIASVLEVSIVDLVAGVLPTHSPKITERNLASVTQIRVRHEDRPAVTEAVITPIRSAAS